MEDERQRKSNEKYTLFYIAFQVLRVPLKKKEDTATRSFISCCFILAFTLGSIDKKLLSESVEKIKMTKIFFTDNIQ